MATSLDVSVAAQKYGGDSTHPICSKVGTTSFVGLPSSWGSTYAKFHSSPSTQSMRQNPSLISHFAMKIFAFSSASANVCTMRDNASPIWSIAPFGAVFSVVSLTAAQIPPFLSRKQTTGQGLICRLWICVVLPRLAIFLIPWGGCLLSSPSPQFLPVLYALSLLLRSQSVRLILWIVLIGGVLCQPHPIFPLLSMVVLSLWDSQTVPIQ
jgi:hypothetical protein